MNKNIYLRSNILAWVLVLLIIGNYVFGWTSPTQTPPGGNVTMSSSQWITSGSDIYYNLGNVGIGTTSPWAALDVIGPSSLEAAHFERHTTSTTGSWGILRLIRSSTGTVANGFGAGLTFSLQKPDGTFMTNTGAIDSVMDNGTAGAEAYSLRLFTNSAGNYNERMTILSNGNVGIGTTAPFAKVTIPSGTGYNGMFGIETAADAASRRWWIHTDYQAYGDFAISTESTKQQGVNPNLNRFYIGPTGNVGIGTTGPADKLAVRGGISKETSTGIDSTWDNFIKYGHYSDLESGDTRVNRWHGIDATITAGAAASNKMKFRVYGGGGGNAVPVDVMTLQGDGNVGIGRTPTTNKLEVEGNASKTTAGDWLANSDIRIKTDVQTIENALEKIGRLRPVRFKYTDEYMVAHPTIKDRYYYNFIAQEFQEVFPDSVQDGGEGYLQLDAYVVNPYLVAAIKEQQKQIEDLKAELEELKAQLNLRQ